MPLSFFYPLIYLWCPKCNLFRLKKAFLAHHYIDIATQLLADKYTLQSNNTENRQQAVGRKLLRYTNNLFTLRNWTMPTNLQENHAYYAENCTTDVYTGGWPHTKAWGEVMCKILQQL